MKHGYVEVRPLGLLAPARRAEVWSAAGLKREPVLPAQVRAHLINYLSECPVFLAWMEYTRDEIADRFGVSGGSAIASDGTYYWRLDSIEYIREYGIPIPREAIEHFEELDWKPPIIDRPRFLEIYRTLDELLGAGEAVG